MSKVIIFCNHYTLVVIIIVSTVIPPYQAVKAESLTLAFGSSETPPRKWKQDGKYTGIYIDIVQEIISRSNIDIELKPFPYKRLLRSLQEGKIDGAVGLYKTNEREQFSTYIETPIAYSSIHIFVKKDKQFKLEQIKDLSGMTVGKIRGVFISDNFIHASQQGIFLITETTTYKQLIGQLMLERIDAFVGPTLSTHFLLKEMDLNKEIVMLPYPITSSRPLYILFSKAASTPEKEAMFDKIRQTLTNMDRENRFNQITQKYIIVE